MIPVNANGVPIGEIPFVRSGLLGFVGPVSRMVHLKHNICGSFDSPLTLSFNGCALYYTNVSLHFTGQPDLCSGEDRRPAHGERAQTQR